MYSFGSGVLIGTRTDIINATPVNFGLVQEVTIEEAATVKELYGQYQYPLAVARGTIKTTGKAKVARISGLAFANLFYGTAPVAGQLATAFAEAASVPAAAPYTVTPANGASFVDDAGPIYATTGLPLTRVATSAPLRGNMACPPASTPSRPPTPGRRCCSTTPTRLLPAASASPCWNQLTGTTPTFQAQFYTTFQGQAVSLKLNACTSSKLSLQTKLEDFVVPEFELLVLRADATGTVMTWSFAEAS